MKRQINRLLIVYRNLSLPLKVSVWFFFCSLLQKGLSFFTTPIFTRIISTEDYGVISIFNSWESVISIFVTLGLSFSVQNVGLVKFSDDKDSYQSSMIGLLITCASFFSVIIIAFYEYLEPIVQLDKKYISLMLVYCVFNTLMAMWLLRERFEYNYKKMICITVINTIFAPILSIILVLSMNDKAYAKVLGVGIVAIIIGGVCGADFIKRSKKLFVKKYWKFALDYNLPMIPHFLSTVILGQLDRIMIKNICGSSQAGIYSVAYSSANVINIINSALHASYNPWLLQRLKAKNYNGIKEIVNAILLCYMMILTAMILFAPEIMIIMAPLEYYEGIYVIPPVACSMFFTLVFNVVSPIEQYSLKTKFIAIASICSAVANVVLNYVCIKSFGYLAAGYTTLACYILFAAAHYVYMKRICKIDLNRVNLFEDGKICFMGIVVVVIAILSALIYPYRVIRYMLLIIILMILVLKRKKIWNIFAILKSK